MKKNITYIRHQGIMNEDMALSHAEAPVITKEDYESRIQKLLDVASPYSHLLIYADKEHFSNLEYLTGYDPRYEECLYILRPGELPRLVLGNEGMGQAQCVTAPHEKILCQLFSPMGQPRGTSSTLSKIFQSAGLGMGSNTPRFTGWASTSGTGRSWSAGIPAFTTVF